MRSIIRFFTVRRRLKKALIESNKTIALLHMQAFIAESKMNPVNENSFKYYEEACYWNNLISIEKKTAQLLRDLL